MDGRWEPQIAKESFEAVLVQAVGHYVLDCSCRNVFICWCSSRIALMFCWIPLWKGSFPSLPYALILPVALWTWTRIDTCCLNAPFNPNAFWVGLESLMGLWVLKISNQSFMSLRSSAVAFVSSGIVNCPIEVKFKSRSSAADTELENICAAFFTFCRFGKPLGGKCSGVIRYAMPMSTPWRSRIFATGRDPMYWSSKLNPLSKKWFFNLNRCGVSAKVNIFSLRRK